MMPKMDSRGTLHWRELLIVSDIMEDLLPVCGESRIVPQLLSCNGHDPEYEGTFILQNISNHLSAGTV